MNQRVSIIGAGPAGLLLALYLLRRHNYQIDIYELRSDPRNSPQLNSNNYPLILCQRGIAACQKVDGLIEAIKSAGIEIEGAITFNNNRNKFKSKRKKLISINRQTLVITLLRHISNNYGSERIRIHFEHKFIQSNLAQKQATFQLSRDSESTADQSIELTIDYDLLIGADGVHSKVRNSCLREAGIECKKQPSHLNYKSLFLSSLSQSTKNSLELGRVYGWRSSDGITLLASRQKDRAMGCTLFVPTDNKSLDQLHTTAEILNFFAVNFPAIADSISDLEAQAFLRQNTAKIWTISCDRYHYKDSVLIIGDAAHALSPTIGQGCNSALEDVMVIDSLLDQHGDNWNQVLPAYSQLRVADAHAVRELADHALPLTKSMFILFILKLTIDRTLHRLLPRFFSLPFFDLISDTTISYSAIYRGDCQWIALVKKNNLRYLNRV